MGRLDGFFDSAVVKRLLFFLLIHPRSFSAVPLTGSHHVASEAEVVVPVSCAAWVNDSLVHFLPLNLV